MIDDACMDCTQTNGRFIHVISATQYISLLTIRLTRKSELFTCRSWKRLVTSFYHTAHLLTYPNFLGGVFEIKSLEDIWLFFYPIYAFRETDSVIDGHLDENVFFIVLNRVYNLVEYSDRLDFSMKKFCILVGSNVDRGFLQELLFGSWWNYKNFVNKKRYDFLGILNHYFIGLF